MNNTRSFSQFGIFLFLLAALWLVPSHLQAQEVEVESVSPDLEEVKAGEIVTYSFRIENNSGQDGTFTENVGLPEGWQLMFPEEEFDISAGDSRTRSIMVRVPEHARAGSSPVNYEVYNVNAPELGAVASVVTRVEADKNLTIFQEDAPDRAIAGEQYTVLFRLTNPGNVAMGVDLSVDDLDFGTYSLSRSSVERLEPGDTVPVEVTVWSDSEISRRRTQRIRLTADSEELNGGSITESVVARVDIYPTEAGQPNVLLPVNFRLYAGISDDGNGGEREAAQAELQGEGYVDEDQENFLDFLFRAPNQNDENVSGMSRREHYGIGYETPLYTLEAGDRTYDLTELTTGSRYGRGGGAALRPVEGIETGAHYREDRFRTNEREDIAAYVTTTPFEHMDVGLNFLHRDQNNPMGPTTEGEVYSVNADWEFFNQRDRLEWEFAHSDAGNGFNETDQAWRFEYGGDAALADDFAYSLRAERFNPDYFGRTRDRERYSGTLRYPLVGSLQGYTDYWYLNRNLDRVPGQGSAIEENRFRQGFDMDLSQSVRATLEYEQFDAEDQLPGGTRDDRERAGHLSVQKRFDRGSLRAEYSHGELETATESETAWETSVAASYYPHQRLQLSLHGQYGDNHGIDGRLIDDYNDVGARARWAALNNLDFDLYYRKANFDEDSREQDRYQANVSWRITDAHSLDLDVRHIERQGSDRADRTSGLLTYNYSFDLPMARRSDVAGVEGRLYTINEDGERVPIESSVVYAGNQAAISDSDGGFAVYGLESGEQELEVNGLDIGPGYVPSEDTPETVNVSEGETTEVNVTVIRAAEIRGRVMIEHEEGGEINNGNGDASGEGETTEPEGFSDAIVEVRSGDEVYRTTTDDDGSFRFGRLMPGSWTVQVYEQNVPDYHELVEPQKVVEVGRGETGQLEFNIRPVNREIEVIDEGEIEPDNGDDE